MIKAKIINSNMVPNDQLSFAVIMASYNNKWLFVRHKERSTWEIPGGHRDDCEPIEKTAARELYEETGTVPSVLELVCIYCVNSDNVLSYGALFYASVATLDALPDMEIAEVKSFGTMPDNLTYPAIQPLLFEAGSTFAASWAYTLSEVFWGEQLNVRT
jgi:8-oxo-dGTP diphosphatase